MKSKTKKFLLIFLLAELLLSYSPAFAQTAPPPYTGVQDQIAKYLCTPNPVADSQTSLTNGAFQNPTTFATNAAANNSNAGVLYQCINQLYKFAIVIAGVFGVFFIVIAGYLYMSSDGNSEATNKAKDILVTTITSFVILMSGFLLLKTINPDLIQFHNVQPPTVVPNNVQPPSTSGGTGGTGGGGGLSQSEQNARKFLSDNGIAVNATPPQTILAGMQQSTLNAVVSLKQACGPSCGQITVTGGTEQGHSETGTCTHSQGYKIDLGVSAGLDQFITKTYKDIGLRSTDKAPQYQNFGVIYARETSPDHWDISVCGG